MQDLGNLLEELNKDDDSLPIKKDKKNKNVKSIKEEIALSLSRSEHNQLIDPTIIDHMANQFTGIGQDVINQIKHDRAEATAILDHFKAKLFTNQNNKIEKPLVDGVTQTLNALTNMSTSLTKLLDSYARLISASKSGLNSKKATASHTKELDELLNIDRYEDEK